VLKRLAKLRLSKEATIMSHQKMYRAVVAYVRLMAFALAQEAKKVSLRKPQQMRAQ
jgi:hypothetical protein